MRILILYALAVSAGLAQPINGLITLPNRASAPSAPAAGDGYIYGRADHLCYLDSSGSEACLGASPASIHIAANQNFNIVGPTALSNGVTVKSVNDAGSSYVGAEIIATPIYLHAPNPGQYQATPADVMVAARPADFPTWVQFYIPSQAVNPNIPCCGLFVGWKNNAASQGAIFGISYDDHSTQWPGLGGSGYFANGAGVGATAVGGSAIQEVNSGAANVATGMSGLAAVVGSNINGSAAVGVQSQVAIGASGITTSGTAAGMATYLAVEPARGGAGGGMVYIAGVEVQNHSVATMNATDSYAILIRSQTGAANAHGIHQIGGGDNLFSASTKIAGGMVLATTAAPTVAASEIGLGNTTAAAANCGGSAAGCWVINVAGTTRYVAYF